MQTTTQEISKLVLNVTEITEAQIREDGRGYNPSEWDKIISRFASYTNCKFYKAAPQRGYDYVRYYAVYETPEGLIFMNSVSYSSSLTNGGFIQVKIVGGTQVYRTLLSDGKGNYGYGGADKANREIMARNSKNHGTIYSKEF